MGRRNLWLPVLFFGSGTAALIYEITWSRMLALVMGTAVQAVATVLASFFLGMAVGSWLFGKLAHRFRRPGVVFAFMEAGIGVYALLVPWLLHVAESGYVGWVRSTGVGLTGRVPLTFALSFLILLIPATLMGGTFPVLLRAFYRGDGKGGRSVSFLYGSNTAGAVAGAFLAGFVLLPFHGVRAAILVGFVLNIAVAVAAYAVAAARGAADRNATRPTPERPRAAPLDSRASALLAGSAIAGFCALGCEVLWTRSLVFLVGLSVYAFAAMLTTFILGFSLGGWIAATFIDRLRHRMAALGGLQMLVGAMILASPWLFSHVRDISQLLFGNAPVVGVVDRTLFMFVTAGTVMLPATIAMGIAFPLFVHAYIESRGHDRGDGEGDPAGHGGALLALNTVGGTLGALFTGFFLIGSVGIRGGLFTLGVLASISGVALLFGLSRAPWPRRLATAAVPATVVLALLPIQSLAEPFVDLSSWGGGTVLASYEEDHTASVSVIHRDSVHTMAINSTAIHSEIDLAAPTIANDFVTGHLPMLLHADPQEVLQIGMGTAVTLGSIAAHPVERIAAVEICPAVPRAARLFDAVNGGVLDDPRLELIVNDGRNQLLVDPRKYDVIVSDAWLSMISGISPLSTVEFYTLVRERLQPGGIFVPGPSLLGSTYKTELRTLLSVFNHVYVFAFPNTDCYTTVASVEPVQVDWERLTARFADPALAGQLEILELREPADLLATFVCGTDCARSYAGPGARDTDDLPVTRYDVPLMPATVINAPFLWGSPDDEVTRLLSLADSPLDILAGMPRGNGLMSKLQRFATANRTVIRARNVTGSPTTRFSLYERALRIDDRNPAATRFFESINQPSTVFPALYDAAGETTTPSVLLKRPITVIAAEDFHDRSGGNAAEPGWTLWSNGYLRVDVNSATDATYSFKMRARGDLIDGQGPRVALLVDDRETAVLQVDVERWADFSLPLRLSAGRHALWLLFTNDALSSEGGDRNLHVQHLVFEAGSYTESAAVEGEAPPG